MQSVSRIVEYSEGESSCDVCHPAFIVLGRRSGSRDQNDGLWIGNPSGKVDKLEGSREEPNFSDESRLCFDLTPIARRCMQAIVPPSGTAKLRTSLSPPGAFGFRLHLLAGRVASRVGFVDACVAQGHHGPPHVVVVLRTFASAARPGGCARSRGWHV